MVRIVWGDHRQSIWGADRELNTMSSVLSVIRASIAFDLKGMFMRWHTLTLCLATLAFASTPACSNDDGSDSSTSSGGDVTGGDVVEEDGVGQDAGVEDVAPSSDADSSAPDDLDADAAQSTDTAPETGPSGGDVDLADADRRPDGSGDAGESCPDSDNDGLDDCEERQFGSDPNTKDTDSDGLDDQEERQLGTDPRDGDTDDDGLSDFEELQKQTDPTEADTDGDGADDREELEHGLDPNDPDTYDDGTLDGNRWRLEACNNPEAESVNFYEGAAGDWTLALRPSFDNYRDSDTQQSGQSGNDLTINGVSPPVAAAVYGDPANEVAGFLLSKEAESSLSTPSDALARRVRDQKISKVGSIEQPTTGGNFDTHDGHRAAIGEYRIQVPQSKSTRKVRDELMFAMAEGSFQRQDVQGLPDSVGTQYQTFQVSVSVIYRQPKSSGATQSLLSVGVAPSTKYANRDKTKAQVDDLTNTTNISGQIDTHLTRCATFQPGKDVPKAEFYWVLDQSGSMRTENQKVADFSTQFEKRVRNTALRYRLGVTNMDPRNKGRLERNAGWHKSGSTFSSEVQNRVIDCSESGNSTAGSWQCSSGVSPEEMGLRVAQEGIRYMGNLSTQPPQPFEAFRDQANIVTIFMSDEDAGMLRENSGNRQQLLGDYIRFFQGQATVFSIGTDGDGCGTEDTAGYREVALATQGKSASLCADDLTETIRDIIFTATWLASNYILPQDPISTSLRVYLNDTWVPRSRDEGFAYFAERNSIAFFGENYIPRSAQFDCIQKYNRNQCDCNAASNSNCKIGEFAGDYISVHYETYKDRCKETQDTCNPSPPGQQ